MPIPFEKISLIVKGKIVMKCGIQETYDDGRLYKFLNLIRFIIVI